MGDDIYQDPSESINEKKKAIGPINNAKMDDMGDDVYQEPSTAIVTTKPDNPFNDDVFQEIKQSKRDLPHRHVAFIIFNLICSE